MNIIFKILKCREYCGKLTDIVALNRPTSHSNCYFFSREERNKGVGGRPPENLDVLVSIQF